MTARIPNGIIEDLDTVLSIASTEVSESQSGAVGTVIVWATTPRTGSGSDLMDQIVLDHDARLGAAGPDLDTAHRRIVDVESVDGDVGYTTGRVDSMLACRPAVDHR